MVKRKGLLIFLLTLFLIGMLILIYHFMKRLGTQNSYSEKETLRKLEEEYQEMLKLAQKKCKIVNYYKLEDFLNDTNKKIALFKFYEKVDDLKEDSFFYKIVKMRNGFIGTSWLALMGLPDSNTRLLVSYMDNGVVFHYFMPKNYLTHNELEDYFTRMIDYMLKLLYFEFSNPFTYTLVISKESFDGLKLEKDELAVKIGILSAVYKFSLPIEVFFET